jgi:hypothetical protein
VSGKRGAARRAFGVLWDCLLHALIPEDEVSIGHRREFVYMRSWEIDCVARLGGGYLAYPFIPLGAHGELYEIQRKRNGRAADSVEGDCCRWERYGVDERRTEEEDGDGGVKVQDEVMRVRRGAPVRAFG